MHKLFCKGARKRNHVKRLRIDPLNPKSDSHLMFPYNITRESKIDVTRIKEMVTNRSNSRLFNKFSLSVFQEIYGE